MVCLIGVSLVGMVSYLRVYISLLSPLILLFMINNSSSVKVVGFLGTRRKTVAFLMSVLIVGLAGIPPFSGFFAKAYGVYLILGMGFILVGVFFILLSTARLVFYTNIVFITIVSFSSYYCKGLSLSKQGGFVGGLGGLSVLMFPLLLPIVV